MAANKVKFGLSNVVYALETETDVYGEVKKWPGAVSMSRELQGEENAFYADNMNYYGSYNFQGYSCELECAILPEDVEKDILGDEVDEETGIMKESRDAKSPRFAIGFQIDGDVQNRRYWNYGCTMSRPNTEASTIEESKEPQTDTVNMTVSGLTNSPVVTLKTSSKTSPEILEKFFDQVVMPDDYDSLKAPVI